MGRLRNSEESKDHMENTDNEHILFTPFSSFASFGGNLYEAKSLEKAILKKSKFE